MPPHIPYPFWKSILLIGSKLYKSKTKSIQGPGSNGNDANFNFYFNQFPSYVNQSEYYYPNNNFSFFGENIFYLSEKFGKFIPKDFSERTECLSWLFWQMGSTPYLGGGFGHFYKYAPIKIRYAIDR